MTILVKNKHTLQIDDFKFRCCIGKKGSITNKKEGDKKTPKGTFEVEYLYFRKDRREKPSTLLKCIEIKKYMGWCNDILFPRKYNKLPLCITACTYKMNGISNNKIKVCLLSIYFMCID